MKSNRIEKITIVGGGTSAWLTAAYLSKNAPLGVDIVVIDKKDGNPVGVGEATTISFKDIMDDSGIPINEWFNEIDATLKSGILFTNWNKDGEDIWHPFYFPHVKPLNAELQDLWTKHQHYDYKTYATELYESSVFDNSVDPDNLDVYAFHIDCGKLVKFLQKKLLSRKNVTLIKKEVVDVKFDNDNVENITLEDGTVITSSLFIDCTGFKRVISPKSEPLNLRDRLFCDTAIAGHIPYNDVDKERNPYVICDAVDHGWIWNIPVRSRIGSGLVFNRSVTDIEEAKDYYVKYWNNRVDRESLKVIDWTPYYHENMWQGNVISIGLSAGFIEPLESTGITLICAGIWQLANPIRTGFFTDVDPSMFNSSMKYYFEDSVDFVNMHYWNTQRDGKFWEWVKDNYQETSRLLSFVDDLKMNEYTLPNKGMGIFTGHNWSVWLCQLGFEVCKKRDEVDDDQSEEVLKQFYFEKNEKRKTLPHHSKFLNEFSQSLKVRYG